MARVFISHARKDHALAGWLHRWLVGEGYEVFFDQDPDDGFTLGEAWEQRLHDELRRADAVVCVLTSAYLASRWCTAEVAIARSRGSRLLPVLAEPGVIDPLLTSVQFIDMTRDPSAVRPALVAALHQLAAAWPDDRSPFPGLRPFEVDQHQVFFGRADDVGQLTELLRSPAEHAKGAALLVVGPSGCGKSSLIRAGLGPVMAGEPGWWALPPILPGVHPVAALARELATAARQCGLEWTVEHVHQRLDENGLTGLADELLLAAPGGPRRRLLVVVDQLEELLTQTDPAERTRFAELLRPALAGPVHVVATMRPEFLDQLLLDPDLAFFVTQTYMLRPLRREALRVVIEKPARLAGIELDDGLVDRLVEDTDSGEALPLLAFTLAQLAEGITRGGRLLSARYDQLGGVQGALTRQADAALAEAVTAGGRSREEVIAGLLRLVTVDEQGHPTRWRARRDELPTPVITELAAFVARRLLTTDTDNGTVVIGVAHEAFLTAWPPLAQAITTSASALRARRAVEHATTEWHHHACPPARLWSGGQLAAAVTDTGAHFRAGTALANAPCHPPQGKGPARWLRRHRMLVTDRVDLSPKARDFLQASIRRDRFRRRRATTILSVLLILALVAAGVAVDQQRRAQAGQQLAQEQERIATARQLAAQADVTRSTDPHTALQLGLAAHRIYPNDETYTSLVNTLTDTHYAGTLNNHAESLSFSTMVFTLDGRTLATVTSDELSENGDVISEGQVILWDLADPTQPRRLGSLLTGLPSYVESVVFAPDGRTLATVARDDGDHIEMILWDLADPTQPRRLGPLPIGLPSTYVESMTFTPDGRTLVTVTRDDSSGYSSMEVALWDLTDPAQPRRSGSLLTGFPSYVEWVVFAPDGRTLATVTRDELSDNDDVIREGEMILWDLADPAQPRRLGSLPTDRTSYVESVVFAPDGRTLVTETRDDSGETEVILWDVADPAQPRQLRPLLTEYTDIVLSVLFAPDGRTLVVVAGGRRGGGDVVILWDLTDPTWPGRLDLTSLTLTGSESSVSLAAFAHDGHTLFTYDDQGTVVLGDFRGRDYFIDHAIERACSITGGGFDQNEWASRIPGLTYQESCRA